MKLEKKLFYYDMILDKIRIFVYNISSGIEEIIFEIPSIKYGVKFLYKNGRILFIDYLGSKIYMFNFKKGDIRSHSHEKFKLPENLNLFSDKIIVEFKDC